jgi:hypothetical protein
MQVVARPCPLGPEQALLRTHRTFLAAAARLTAAGLADTGLRRCARPVAEEIRRRHRAARALSGDAPAAAVGGRWSREVAELVVDSPVRRSATARGSGQEVGDGRGGRGSVV